MKKGTLSMKKLSPTSNKTKNNHLNKQRKHGKALLL
jgi:hypothetical protein